MNRNVYRVGVGWWLPFVLWLVFAGLVGYVMGGSEAKAQNLSHPEWYNKWGYVNGRYWLTRSLDAKLAFIEAVRDGVNAASELLGTNAAKSDPTMNAKTVFEFYIPPESMTLGDISEGLDKLYSEVANRPISIMNALIIISARARGKDEKLIQEWLMDDRRAEIVAAEGPPAPPPPQTKEVKK